MTPGSETSRAAPDTAATSAAGAAAAGTPTSGTATLRPRDDADLAEILASHPRALEPIGGGSKRELGQPVDADALELGAFSGIEVYEPAELVLTARAATPLHAIERELGARSQRLAFEPPDFGPLLGVPRGASSARTIGGVLATNLAGSRRVAAGAARDHFLGCAAVNGRGERFNAGGRVVKNVTGYDVPKLLAGSWGTLAVLTTVTVRVVPASETQRTLVVPSTTPEDALAIMTAALGSAHDVSSAAYDPARGCLLRLEGFAASVEARASALRSELARADSADRARAHFGEIEDAASRELWSEIGGAAALAAWPVVWRISVPPSDAPRVLAEIAPERYLLDWAGGLVFAAFTEVEAARVRTALRSGHAMLLKAPRGARASTAVFQPQPPALVDAARRLKRAFDPYNRLNPGRLD